MKHLQLLMNVWPSSVAWACYPGGCIRWVGVALGVGLACATRGPPGQNLQCISSNCMQKCHKPNAMSTAFTDKISYVSSTFFWKSGSFNIFCVWKLHSLRNVHSPNSTRLVKCRQSTCFNSKVGPSDALKMWYIETCTFILGNG